MKKCHPELVSLVSTGLVALVQQKLDEEWDPNVRNEDGISPILKAAERNDLEMVRVLLKAGASVDVSDIVGDTPLRQAESHGNEEMIKLMKDSLQAHSKQESKQK
jgi:ankyrin repeat protein